VSPCQQKKRKGERLPLKIEGARGEALLTSNWKIPASASLRVGGTSTAPASASVRPTGTSFDGPVAGGSAPASGTNSTAAASASGDRGAGSHLSEVVCSPSLSSSSFDDEFVDASGGESPCCSRSRYSSLCCSMHSHCLILFSFVRAARSYSRCCVARPAAQA
jgi:hypothetical protein